MGVSSRGPGETRGSSRRGWVGGSFVGLAAGVAICAAIGVFKTVLDSRKHDPGGAGAGAQIGLASKAVQTNQPAVTETKSEKRAVEPARREQSPPAHVTAGGADKNASLTANVQSTDPTAAAAVTGRVARLAGDPFKLAAAAASTPASAILPNEAWFALADVTNDEPASCGATPAFCAVNRSLNTALTWAKSPAEAAEEAERDGKLVFLIHVSGNFENPGFT